MRQLTCRLHEGFRYTVRGPWRHAFSAAFTVLLIHKCTHFNLRRKSAHTGRNHEPSESKTHKFDLQSTTTDWCAKRQSHPQTQGFTGWVMRGQSTGSRSQPIFFQLSCGVDSSPGVNLDHRPQHLALATPVSIFRRRKGRLPNSGGGVLAWDFQLSATPKRIYDVDKALRTVLYSGYTAESIYRVERLSKDDPRKICSRLTYNEAHVFGLGGV